MTTPSLCPECGRPLPPTLEVCPSCLLAQGMATATGGQAEGAIPDLQEIQTRFPQFEILECLGRGGMGIVYKARQKSLNRLVAIKVLAPEREHDSHFSARFSREAEILARLNHPHIVTIHDFGESGGLFYLVMEFVDGVNLREILSEGRMEPRQALAIVPEICDALQYAHDQGIVHRDIKPENILLDRSGRVKVADFGIAKLAGLEVGGEADGTPAAPNLTAAGKVLGTPAYMAPEQMSEPDKVDHRADIYAVGAVFYQMLTGETPKYAAAPPSRKVDIDVRLDEIVLRALEKDPERRYQQVSEVRTRLDTLNSPRLASAVPTPAGGGESWFPLLVKVFIGLLIAMVLIFVGSLTWFSQGKVSPRQDSASPDYAWKLWNEQKFPEAREAFEKALKVDPRNAGNWNGLGWSLFHTGSTDDAVTAFEKAVQLNPTMPGALNGLGQIALGKGEYKKAEEYLLRAAPMASAAWFGLTRVYLLQGEYEKAVPWAQKIVDSGQGGEIAKELLQAAQNGKLDDKLRRKISPPTVNPNAAKEPPKLQALSWLDKPGETWNAEGRRFSLAASGLPISLTTPSGMNIQAMPYATKNPRFLCLWFSQPTFDNMSVVRVELHDLDGKPLDVPSPETATGATRPGLDTQGLGWLTETICAGTMTSTPDRVAITLHYSGGPWQFWDNLEPDFHGSMTLSDGVRLTPPFQSNDGRASVLITRDKEFDTGNAQWDFVAHTRDGRKLERNGSSASSSGNVTTQIFLFDTPLSQVEKFEIRKRPIKTMNWPNVPLLSDKPIVLEILPDGSVRRGQEIWPAAELARKFREIKDRAPEQKVLLKPDPSCPYDRVKDALTACAGAGLTRVGLLQGEYGKAVPSEQKIADSGRGGEIAKEPLQAAQNGKLDDKLQRKISPPAVNPNAAKEPPKLQALAWLDKPGDTWNVEGKRFSFAETGYASRLLTPYPVEVAQISDQATNPRFLCLWFSQPAFDNLSVAKIDLLAPDGKPIETPTLETATGTDRASSETGNLGWITSTICAGTMASTPDRVSIVLRYSAGPWQFWGDLAPTEQGIRTPATGISLTPPYQSNEGRAAVEINRDSGSDKGGEQWDIVAITRDGKRLERAHGSKSTSGNVTTTGFYFDAPLSNLTKFEIRKRPIQSMTWTNVPLLSDQPVILEILADGTIEHGEESWKIDELAQKLKAIKEVNPDLAVIVKPAWDCSYERVKGVLNACAAAGITNLAMTTPGVDNE